MTAEPYDQGGMLPGGRVAMTLTGRPERVLDPRQTEEFK